LTKRQALHTAEVLSLATQNPNPDAKGNPERDTVRRREQAQRRSMQKAASVLGVIGIVALGAMMARNR